MISDAPISSTLADMSLLAPIPMLAVEPETGAIVHFNQLARDTLDIAPRPGHLKDLFDNPTVARQLLLMARNQGFVRQFEARIKLANGARNWMLIAARLIDTANESLIILCLNDIHERRMVEDDLRDSELRHRRILETANEGYVLFNAKTGDVLEINPALCQLLGYSHEALMTMRYEELITEDSITYLRSQRKRWLTLPHHRIEIGLRRADGARITAEVSISGITDQDGRISSIFALLSDITARKLNEDRVLYLAFYDTLTALPNRFLFAEHLDQALRQRQRRGGSLALMFIDLDDFKHVNDTYGHDIGDELLKIVAKRLSHCVRASDTVSRQGGDEFVVLLANLNNADDAKQVAEKMLDALLEPVHIEDATLEVRASIGIAMCPEDGETAAALRRHADIAMYQAKFGGKHRFALYEPSSI